MADYRLGILGQGIGGMSLPSTLRPHGPTSRSRVGTNPETSPKGPLAQRAQAPPTPSNGAHIIVEGQLRHRIYQKQVQAGKKTVAVDVSVAEIHATTIRKLDRNGSSANTGEELSEEASEQSAIPNH